MICDTTIANTRSRIVISSQLLSAHLLECPIAKMQSVLKSCLLYSKVLEVFTKVTCMIVSALIGFICFVS